VSPSTAMKEQFAFRLRQFVPEGQVRAAARVFDPADPERGKRNLNRWLAAKVLPSTASRDRLCAALGVDASELPLPDDDSEPEPVDLNAELSRAISDLRRVQRLVKGQLV